MRRPARVKPANLLLGLVLASATTVAQQRPPTNIEDVHAILSPLLEPAEKLAKAWRPKQE